jgi:hypothetical protein
LLIDMPERWAEVCATKSLDVKLNRFASLKKLVHPLYLGIRHDDDRRFRLAFINDGLEFCLEFREDRLRRGRQIHHDDDGRQGVRAKIWQI